MTLGRSFTGRRAHAGGAHRRNSGRRRPCAPASTRPASARHDHGHASAIRSEIEPAGAAHVCRPHAWFLRNERVAAHGVADRHDLVAGPVQQLAAVRRPRGRPPAAVGDQPPFAARRTLAANARTYTSNLPDSFDVYAIHRPSGENAASASMNFVVRNRSGVRGFQSVAVVFESERSRFADCHRSGSTRAACRPT